MPPSTLESEAPPRLEATDVSNGANTCPLRLMLLCQSILGKTIPGSMDILLKHVKMRPAKQRGCEKYELLSHLDKIEV